MVDYDKNLTESFGSFKIDNSEFSDLTIANKELNIIFRSSSIKPEFTDNVLARIIKSWIEKENSFKIDELRFLILKSDPYQFCAINTKSRIGFCGSITKKGNYCLAFLIQGSNKSLIGSSVALNKWIWNQI